MTVKQKVNDVVIKVENKVKSGLGNEQWYQSRRVWAAGLSVIAILALNFMPEQYDVIVTCLDMVAGGLAITSWVKPK